MYISNQKFANNNNLTLLNNSAPKYYLTKTTEVNNNNQSNHNNKPSFKGGFPDICKKILNDPKLAQQFMGLMALGTASFLTAANGDSFEKIENTDTKDKNETNPIKNFFESIFQQQKEEDKATKINKELEEFNKLKQEHEKLKKEIKLLRQQTVKILEDNKNKLNSNQEEASEELVTIQFPKGKGNHTKFKNVIEQVKVHKEIGEKLKEICQAILNKSELINKEEFIKNLSSKIGSTVDLENYIDEIHKILHQNEKTKQTDEDNEKAKILARIKESEHDRLRTKIKTDLTKEKDNTEFSVEDSQNNIYKFKIPGTISNDYLKNLTMLLLQFEEKYNQTCGSSKWMHRHPVTENVREIDISNEIKKRRLGTSPYKNITPEQAVDLKELINSDSRYSEMFTLHSALRFIDRFVDFDSNVPIQEQSRKNLDYLFEALNTAFHNGVQIEPYQDCKHEAYGARIIVDSDSKRNPAAYKLAGSFPLMLTICENQPIRGYYNKRNKTPLISTIFADGN